MEFFIGFLGAIIAVTLFILGIVVGYVLRGKEYERMRRVTAEQLTESQKRRLQEEQEAWSALHNYSVEDAYNVHPIPSDKE